MREKAMKKRRMIWQAALIVSCLAVMMCQSAFAKGNDTNTNQVNGEV